MSVKPYIARALALAALTMAACSKPPEQKVPPVPVELVAVSKISAPLTLDANGVVEPAQTVMIQGQVTGTIQQIGFQEGDDVQLGQMLFQLDPRPFEAALHQADAAHYWALGILSLAIGWTACIAAIRFGVPPLAAVLDRWRKS